MKQGHYAIPSETYELLQDARRHAGALLGLAAAVTERDERGDARIELRATELSAVFSFLEDSFREAIDAATWVDTTNHEGGA